MGESDWIWFRTWNLTLISENQCGFMLERSTMEVIFTLRCLMEIYTETCKDLHVVFIDLEKAYDRILREVLLWVLEKAGVLV